MKSVKQARRDLAALYAERAMVDDEIARLEAVVVAWRLAHPGRRLPWQRMEHGSDGAYTRHLREGVPFPEDEGGTACGCRLAHARVQRGVA